MHRPDLPFRVGLILVVVLATFLLGYPAAYLASHGLDARVWPALRGTPVDWFTPEGSGSAAWLAGLVRMGRTYLNMALGRAQALPGGGREAFVLVWGAAIALGSLILMGGHLVPLRHRLRRFGDAQFASPHALARMRKGIELGLDPATGRAARVQVEGMASAIGRPVEVRAYAGRVEIRQDGRVVAEHERAFGRDQTVFDPWHYVPVLARKPGALRNGAPFKDWVLPAALDRVRRKLSGNAGGDRQMVEILTAVLAEGLSQTRIG